MCTRIALQLLWYVDMVNKKLRYFGQSTALHHSVERRDLMFLGILHLHLTWFVIMGKWKKGRRERRREEKEAKERKRKENESKREKTVQCPMKIDYFFQYFLSTKISVWQGFARYKKDTVNMQILSKPVIFLLSFSSFKSCRAITCAAVYNENLWLTTNNLWLAYFTLHSTKRV